MSFSHIVLLILEVSDTCPSQEVLTSMWASMFFMPDRSPYSPSELKIAPNQPPCGVFPLMTVRRRAPFFCKDVASHGEGIMEGDTDVRGLLRSSSEHLLGELRELARPNSVLWDVRSFTALFEYSNCVWLSICDECAAAAEAENPLFRRQST